MSPRDRMILIVVAIVAALGGGYMLAIKPKRAEVTKLDAQVQSVQAQLDTARAQVSSGLQARSQFSSDYTKLAQLGEAVPQDDELPSLILQLQSAAKAAHVAFHGLQLIPASSAPAAGSTPAAGSSSASGAGAQGSGSLPPGASVGAAGLPTEQFTFSFSGSFFNLADFFARLQHFVVASNSHIAVSGRLLTINAINFGPASSGFPEVSASVSATAYMTPSSQALSTGALPIGPTAAPAQASTAAATAGPAAATITPTLR